MMLMYAQYNFVVRLYQSSKVSYLITSMFSMQLTHIVISARNREISPTLVIEKLDL